MKGLISSFSIEGYTETCESCGSPLCGTQRRETAHVELHFKEGESLCRSDGKEDSVPAVSDEATLSPLASTSSSWDEICKHNSTKLYLFLVF